MSPWDFLAWAVALGVGLIVLSLAIVVVIATVKAISRRTRRGPSENHPAGKPDLRIVD